MLGMKWCRILRTLINVRRNGGKTGKYVGKTGRIGKCGYNNHDQPNTFGSQVAWGENCQKVVSNPPKVMLVVYIWTFWTEWTQEWSKNGYTKRIEIKHWFNRFWCYLSEIFQSLSMTLCLSISFALPWAKVTWPKRGAPWYTWDMFDESHPPKSTQIQHDPKRNPSMPLLLRGQCFNIKGRGLVTAIGTTCWGSATRWKNKQEL